MHRALASSFVVHHSINALQIASHLESRDYDFRDKGVEGYLVELNTIWDEEMIVYQYIKTYSSTSLYLCVIATYYQPKPNQLERT